MCGAPTALRHEGVAAAQAPRARDRQLGGRSVERHLGTCERLKKAWQPQAESAAGLAQTTRTGAIRASENAGYDSYHFVGKPEQPPLTTTDIAYKVDKISGCVGAGPLTF